MRETNQDRPARKMVTNWGRASKISPNKKKKIKTQIFYILKSCNNNLKRRKG